ncbi:J domain-containing protein [Haloferacaceae archaeon DSL9]
MDQNLLLMGISAVLMGVAVVMAVFGLAVSPALLFVAIPFGAAAYLMWYQASGRLEGRAWRTEYVSGEGIGASAGFGAGPRDGPRDPRSRFAGGRGDPRQQRSRRGPDPRAERRRAARRKQALRTLGLDRDATGDEIRRAYRSKVKEAHPDTETGSEEAFKRVTRAYDALSE